MGIDHNYPETYKHYSSANKASNTHNNINKATNNKQMKHTKRKPTKRRKPPKAEQKQKQLKQANLKQKQRKKQSLKNQHQNHYQHQLPLPQFHHNHH